MFVQLLKRFPWFFLPLLALVWWLTYAQLSSWSVLLVAALGITPETRLFESLSFFFYDVPKILMLLLAITFVMGMVNSYFTPEKHVRSCREGTKESVMRWQACSVLSLLLLLFCYYLVCGLFAGRCSFRRHLFIFNRCPDGE